MRRNTGWQHESARHSLAARGVKTGSLRTIPAPPFRKNDLPVQVSIIVPSTFHSRDLSEQEFSSRVEAEKRWFSRTFGGDTSTRTVGSYFDGKRFVEESGVKVESSMTVDKYKRVLPVLTKHVRSVRRFWGQDSIMLNVEGQSFVYPKRPFIDDDKDGEVLVT